MEKDFLCYRIKLWWDLWLSGDLQVIGNQMVTLSCKQSRLRNYVVKTNKLSKCFSPYSKDRLLPASLLDVAPVLGED
jgi:hypothetical protein